ncbi:HAD family hydrolase [Enterococcus sp. LJL120]
MAFLGKNSGEILPPHTSKQLGIDFLLSYLEIDKINTVGIGNGSNDIDLFAAVEIKIAMENSNPNLLKLATYITDTPNKGGIYKAFEHFDLF